MIQFQITIQEHEGKIQTTLASPSSDATVAEVAFAKTVQKKLHKWLGVEKTVRLTTEQMQERESNEDKN